MVDAFWAPLQWLCDPGRQRLATVCFRGEPLQRPAIDLLGAGRTVLWGITYRLVCQFLQILGIAPTPLKGRLSGEKAPPCAKGKTRLKMTIPFSFN